VILAAHGAAKGHVATLLDAMAAAHERPAGAWHAEWHALPQLFGLASGALREARRLAEGLVVHPERMRANIDLTHGLIFADAAASALASRLGRGEAHKLVEEAADAVRGTGRDLRSVLGERAGEHAALLGDAFDLKPAVAAAAAWIDRAIAAAEPVLAELRSVTSRG
jgi:3-carboxy-cis,cis-muconate cycloisomerase